MFQGGFVGSECDILSEDDGKDGNHLQQTLFPADINELQEFKLKKCVNIATGQKLHLRFNQSSDFYGRITVYMIHFNGNLL
jgi:hypothetical protein